MRFASVTLLATLFLGQPVATHAALSALSGFPAPAINRVTETTPGGAVAYGLANGFPLWYEDENGLRLELCLDQSAATFAGTFSPCLTEAFFANAPISFPGNFGPEAFWWSATAFGSFASTFGGGDAVLVLAQEAAFANGATVDGAQVAFGRIRLRLNVPVPGTYRVTHPYGQRDYVVTAITAGREINQTQDIGNFVAPGAPPAGNFLLALADGPEPAFITTPVGFPAINAALVSSQATGIGPFLVAADLPGGTPRSLLAAVGGGRYLADPGTETAPLTVPVTGSTFIPEGETSPINVFRIELLDPPANFFLNAAGNGGLGSQVVEFTRFQLMGKVFDQRPNEAPVAMADFVATAKGVAVVIDPLANDVDPDEGFGHGIHPQAIGLPTNPGDLTRPILLTQPLTTVAGGTVRRFTAIPTGKTTLFYTPAPGFTGTDSFAYVTQDRGGLLSDPAIVTVTVEEVLTEQAQFRLRTGKWQVRGTSSDQSETAVILMTAPRARLTRAAEVPPVATQAAGHASLRVQEEAIDFLLQIGPLPATEVFEIHIHVGDLGENGPVIFFLYFDLFDGPFTGTVRGTLRADDLLPRPVNGVSSFSEAVAAIREGRAYVDLHTAANPAGELRGQFERDRVARVPVVNGVWEFKGHATVIPGLLPAIGVRSLNGVEGGDVPVRLR